MDYDKILLTDMEQTVFDKFKNSDTAILTQSEFQILKTKGLVIGAINGKSDWFDDLPQSGACTISDLGKVFRIYQRNLYLLSKHEKSRYRINTIFSIIALLISTASLIVSILALLK